MPLTQLPLLQTILFKAIFESPEYTGEKLKRGFMGFYAPYDLLKCFTLAAF